MWHYVVRIKPHRRQLADCSGPLAGKILLLDTALLPITVCRRILAWAGETPLGLVMPSNHRSLHRTLSLTVCGLAVLHSAAAIWSYCEYSGQVVLL